MNYLWSLRREEPRNLPPLPPGKYRVICADPPWQYDNSNLWGGAEYHYATMKTEDICDYQVKGMSIKEKFPSDCILFLWTTSPMLKDALKVCEEWGFKYKTMMVWIKDKPTYGKLQFYIRSMHETIFICARGRYLPEGELEVSTFKAKKTQHTRKPIEFYEMVEKMYPTGPHLELFARNTRKGWTSHGGELNRGTDG